MRQKIIIIISILFFGTMLGLTVFSGYVMNRTLPLVTEKRILAGCLVAGDSERLKNFLVPKEAVFTSQDVDYVWKIQSKESPLGTRYIVEKEIVVLVDEDETWAEVTGDFEMEDWVVVYVESGLKDGQQVRVEDHST